MKAKTILSGLFVVGVILIIAYRKRILAYVKKTTANGTALPTTTAMKSDVENLVASKPAYTTQLDNVANLVDSTLSNLASNIIKGDGLDVGDGMKDKDLLDTGNLATRPVRAEDLVGDAYRRDMRDTNSGKINPGIGQIEDLNDAILRKTIELDNERNQRINGNYNRFKNYKPCGCEKACDCGNGMVQINYYQ